MKRLIRTSIENDLGRDCGLNRRRMGKHLDSKQDPKENRRLLALMGKREEDWPEYIEENFTCFKTNLETILRTEIGIEDFEKYLQEYQVMFGITKRKHAIKNPKRISKNQINSKVYILLILYCIL